MCWTPVTLWNRPHRTVTTSWTPVSLLKSTCPVSRTKKQIQADSLLPWTPPNLWRVYLSLFAGSNFGAVPDFQSPLFMPLSSAIFSPVDHSGDDNCFLCVDFNALDFSRHEPREWKKTKQWWDKSEQDTDKEALEPPSVNPRLVDGPPYIIYFASMQEQSTQVMCGVGQMTITLGS